MNDDLGMLETAENILSKINEAQEKAEKLNRLVGAVNDLREAPNGSVLYMDDDGDPAIEDWINDPRGRLKDLIIEELVRQIEEEYETLKKLGFTPE